LRATISNMCLDGNRGDLAILAGTVTALRAAVPDVEVTVSPIEVGNARLLATKQADSQILSDTPLLPSPMPTRREADMGTTAWAAKLGRAFVAERLGVSLLESSDDTIFRSAMEDADVLVVKGGSWLFNYPGPAQAIFTQRMLHPMRVAQRTGTPAVILGTSLGPWQRTTQRAYRRTLNSCSSVVVRERLSLDFAERMGLEHVQLGVDMAFALYDGVGGGSAQRSGIAVTPRRLPYESEEAIARYETSVVEAARTLVDATGETCFFAAQVHEDIPLCVSLAARVDRPGLVRVADEINQWPLDQLIAWYGKRRLIIGTRIHSVILAALSHTPSVILECDPPKMIGISEQLGLDTWRISAAGEAISELPSIASRALDATTATEAVLASRLPGLAHQALLQTAEALADAGLKSATPASLATTE
jgi:polysaccharide pyruvyl transferase WcaK-like protein